LTWTVQYPFQRYHTCKLMHAFRRYSCFKHSAFGSIEAVHWNQFVKCTCIDLNNFLQLSFKHIHEQLCCSKLLILETQKQHKTKLRPIQGKKQEKKQGFKWFNFWQRVICRLMRIQGGGHNSSLVRKRLYFRTAKQLIKY